MSASLDAVVSQLRQVIGTLQGAAIVARRAQEDASQATTHYTEAARGTSHPNLTGAVQESEAARGKAVRLANLISKAADSVAAFSNAVVPGSAPTAPSEAAMPSGETLLSESVERESGRRNVGSFLSTMTRNVEDLQDNTQKTVSAAREAFNFIRGPQGPTGTQAGTTTPSASPTLGQRLANEAPDTAGHLVVVGLVAGIAVHRSVVSIRKGIARLRNRERTDGIQRPDSRDGAS
ncbi:hypothetical protein QQG74_06910 [Micromonospora sp. FIMYZ51]|uniref:hypothetical protein n=1 Tax=Micromonospora sp. FIMYZ51 TaxID=3051832 RepID=UPI00311E972D